MFQNKLRYNLALLCFFLFLVLGKNSFSQFANDSLIFEIEGVIEKYKSRYPNMSVILTGGDLKFVKKTLKNINFINPYLLMEGLNYIIAFNNEI